MKKVCSLTILLLFAASMSLVAQQAQVNLDWNPQKNTQDLVPLAAEVISPEVHDDHTVTFRLEAPDVNEVKVVGSMFVGEENGKEVPLKKGKDGIWSTTIGPLDPNIYFYYFIIDGVQVIDPNNTFTGHANMPAFSILHVHGDGPRWYNAKDVPHGNITTHFYHSEVTDGQRYMLVYTPPGYDPAKKYPVLYLMGGSGDLPETWTMHGKVNFIMDNLIAEGKATPTIIAIPNNHVIHRMHPEHRERTFPILEEEFKKHIIPLVEDNYSVIRNRHARAISGLSMGGRHAQYIGLNNLDLFGTVGLLSAAIPVEQTLALEDADINSRLDYFFVGAGTHETYPGVRHEVLHNDLDSLNVEHEYYIGSNGGHDLITWRHLLYYRFLPKLWDDAALPLIEDL